MNIGLICFHMFGVCGRPSISILCGAGLLASSGGKAQVGPSVEELLTRVERRVAEFYRRAQNVICIEKSVVQPIGLNYSPEGLARTVESGLRIQADGEDAGLEPTIVRHARKVNGRQPRERD